MKSTIHTGDCVDVLEQYPDNHFHGLVCDPPYGLTSDRGPEDLKACLRAWMEGEDHGTERKGFMGESWDGAVPSPRVWSVIFAKLRPGAHGAVFSSERTSHLLAIALQLAGFEIRHCLMWIYGSGFPKSLSLRTLGEDYERFGTALKPAFEPIWIVRKPLPKGSTIAATAQEWGTACLDIDGARVASGGEHKRGVIKSASTGRAVSYQAALNGGMSGDGFEATDHDGGRWPANVVFSHLPGCELVGSKRVKRKGGIPKTKINRGMFGSIQPGAVYGDEDGKETVQDWRCVEGCAVKALGEQSGESGDTAHNRGLDGAGLTYNLSRNEDRKRGHTDEGASAGGFGDAGGASRYFHQFEAPPVPFRYCAKCSRREREAGCEHLPPWTPGRATGGREEDSPGLDSPRAGSGRSSAIRNHHPTVKPSKGLLDWLVKLVCPRVPGFEPVVLDPFCGSGSTGLGCVHAGVDFVGIDLDERYTKIAKARIYHADPAQAVASGEALEDVDKGEQGRLF